MATTDVATRLVQVGGGRVLTVDIAGPPEGEVILVHHGSPGSRLLYGPAIADAAARGARLVGYDRPGYGGSTRLPGRAVADVVADLRAIAAALGVERLVTWGLSGGGPHPLACAALAPDLVAAVATFASVGPLGVEGLDFPGEMGELNVESFRLVLEDPAAAAAQDDADAEELVRLDVEGLLAEWESILSPPDRAVLAGEAGLFVVDSLRLGLAPGAAGYSDDNLAFTRPWGFDPADIAVPCLVLQGDQDLMVPPAHGEWLARRVPGATLRRSDDGHLSLLGEVADVHEWLLAVLRAEREVSSTG